MPNLEQLAEAILSARASFDTVISLIQSSGDIDARQAGEVQRLVATRSSGEVSAAPLGYRVVGSGAGGLKSVGIDNPVYGLITSAMLVDDSDVAHLADFSHPCLSGSLALLVSRDLATPPASIEEASEAIELVFPAIDITDRPSADLAVRFVDLVAANAFGGYVVIGDGGRAPSEIDLACCGAVLEIDGELASSGAGAAVLGHPANALIWLVRALSDIGETLKAGAMVLVGEITKPIPIAPQHHARLGIGGLGSASVRFG